MRDWDALQDLGMDWIYEKANGRQFEIVELNEFMTEAGIALDATLELVRDWAGRGWVEDSSTFGGPAARLTPLGVTAVQQRRRQRRDPALRAAAARNGLLRFFYDKACSGVRQPMTRDVLATQESIFMGEQFTVDEVETAAEYLTTKGLIRGSSVAEVRGPVRAEVTAEGRDCIEQYAGNVSEFLRDRDRRGPSISTSIGTVYSSGALAVGSTEVTQHVTVGVDPLAMASFVKVLLTELPNLALGQTAERAAREALEEVQSEVGRPDPQRERVTKALGRFVGYIMDAGKPVLTRLLMLVAQHMGMPPA